MHDTALSVRVHEGSAEGAHETWQTERVVAMEMGDEDLGDATRLHIASHQLNLGAFSTIYQPCLPL